MTRRKKKHKIKFLFKMKHSYMYIIDVCVYMKRNLLTQIN